MDDVPAAVGRLVAAIAGGDFDAIAALMAPDVRFRFLIPGGPDETTGPPGAAATFRKWFGEADVIEVLSVRLDRLPDRTSARYRFLLHEEGGWSEAEQQMYIDVDEHGRIAGIDLLCSGFRPTAGPGESRPSGTHRFDAGTLGCADGLAREFRRRILAIPVGDVLVVEASDPAAKEDLPPLARMMGHAVHSVEPSGNGRLLITVERGR
jgi:TusA-related sulfurtransferase